MYYIFFIQNNCFLQGLHILYPYITKRIVWFSKDDVVTLLSSENPYINRMSKSTQEQLNPLGKAYQYI